LHPAPEAFAELAGVFYGYKLTIAKYIQAYSKNQPSNTNNGIPPLREQMGFAFTLTLVCRLLITSSIISSPIHRQGYSIF
jgi:hypothetical protein